jgi:hypothetical protein
MGYRYNGALIIPQEYESLFEQGLNYYREQSDNWIPEVSDFNKASDNDFIIYAFVDWKRGYAFWEEYAEKLMNWIVGSDREENIEEAFKENPWNNYDNSAMKFATVDWNAWAINQARHFESWEYPEKTAGFYAIGEDFGDVDMSDYGIGLSRMVIIEGSPAGDDFQEIFAYRFDDTEAGRKELAKVMEEAKSLFNFVDSDGWDNDVYLIVGRMGDQVYKRPMTTEQKQFLDKLDKKFADEKSMSFIYDGEEVTGNNYWEWDIYAYDTVEVEYLK